MHGEPSHPRNIFPFFPACGTGSPPPSTTQYDYSTPACCAHPGLHPKESESKVHSQIQLGTLAYRLPYSLACGEYFQTLNNHYHTLRPQYIIPTRTGSHDPAINLMIAVCGRTVKSYNLASSRNYSTFTGPSQQSIQSSLTRGKHCIGTQDHASKVTVKT